MQDTTTPVHKEMIIMCALFLVILVVGIFAFDIYTRQKHVLVLTSATAAEDSTMNYSSKITGNAIGITGAATSDEVSVTNKDKQIGVYSVLPSFSFVSEHNLFEEYDALQKYIRSFYDNVMDCRHTRLLDDCIALTLKMDEYSSWLDDCETNNERLFYDFTEIFSQCLASKDSDCTCTGALEGDYEAGEYTIKLIQDQENTLFSLEDLMLTLPFTFAIEDALMKSDKYTIHVDTTGAIGGFSSLEPSSQIYIYKSDATTLSVEDQSTFTTYETTRDSCTLPSQEVYKFCMQSKTIVENKPLVYIFAVDFSK